jgi:hypothetical protein
MQRSILEEKCKSQEHSCLKIEVHTNTNGGKDYTTTVNIITIS